MRDPSHQTVERFTDRPRSAWPVLGALLRAYNDGVEDARRQELLWCASAVVGTRDRRLRTQRIERAGEFLSLRSTPWTKLVPRSRLYALARAAQIY